MVVVRFLERKWVIQSFGVALIVAPFVNIIIQFLVLNSKTGVSWKYISISSYLLSGSLTNYLLAFGSIIIGAIMLTGSTKAWKAALVLVGCHLLVQVLNYKSKEWQGALGWSAFVVNLSVFLFIADQLVWRVKTKEELLAEAMAKAASLKDKVKLPKVELPKVELKNPGQSQKELEKVLHLTSYKKILFSFGSDKPWGRLMTLTSHQLIVNCFAEPPSSVQDKTVQINFTQNLIVEIKFERKESNLYYFTPTNMNSDKINELNQWLKKIAV